MATTLPRALIAATLLSTALFLLLATPVTEATADGGSGVTPVPLRIPGTIIAGTDYQGKGYCLVSQLMTLEVGNGGVWLTPCEYCRHGDGSGLHFRTRSRFFSRQHEFDVAGDLSAPEGNGRILTLRSPAAFTQLVADDVIMTGLLNEALEKGMTPFARAMLGAGVALNAASLPQLQSNITYMGYMMAYGQHFVPGNWPAQFMLMLQALTTCTTNPMEPFCPELAQAFTPQLLQLKSNEKNEDSQCQYLPCPAGPVPTPRSRTAWINDQEICAQKTEL